MQLLRRSALICSTSSKDQSRLQLTRYSSCVTEWRASHISRSPSSMAQLPKMTIHRLSHIRSLLKRTLTPIRTRAMQQCIFIRAEQTVSARSSSDSRVQQVSGSCGRTSCSQISENRSPRIPGHRTNIQKLASAMPASFFVVTLIILQQALLFRPSLSFVTQ